MVDITETIDRKVAAVTCYKSQFGGERGERIVRYLRSMAAAEGAQAGFTYGEMYALPRPAGIQDMFAMLGAWRIPPPFDAQSPPNRS